VETVSNSLQFAGSMVQRFDDNIYIPKATFFPRVCAINYNNQCPYPSSACTVTQFEISYAP